MSIQFFTSGLSHWKGSAAYPVSHGPQEWRWWRLFSSSIIRLNPWPPSTGIRLWVYTRWGAICFDVYIDHREGM